MIRSDCVKDFLEELFQKFIVIPIDKAHGNVAVICKRFYALTHMKELGLEENHVSDSRTLVRIRPVIN